jgi:hypothetical protein
MKRNKMIEVMRLAERLAVFGFTADDVAGLLKIERTLHRWAEAECGNSNNWGSWGIEREETTGKPYMVHYRHSAGSTTTKTPIADREAGALAKLGKIMAGKRGVVAYHQGDPRGCALYIVPTDKVPKGARVDSCYTNGIAVCI